MYTTDEGDFLHTVVTHRKVATVFQALTPDITINALHELSHLISKYLRSQYSEAQRS